MASSKDYLEFILDQLSLLDEISYKAMMGGIHYLLSGEDYWWNL